MNALGEVHSEHEKEPSDDLYKECLSRKQNIGGLLQELSSLDLTHHEAFHQLSKSKGTTDSTTNARLQMQSVREELAQWGMRISESIREADRLCEEGADVLTPEQFHELKENRDRLSATYQAMVTKTDAILERLNVATSMLIEFSNESSSMHSWINDRTRQMNRIKMESGDPKAVEEAKARVRDFTEDVAHKEATVEAIAQLAKQIENEITLYLEEIAQLHPSLQQPPMDCKDIGDTVQRLRNDFNELRSGCHDLSKFLQKLQSIEADHRNTVRDAESLLIDLEAEVMQTERSSGEEEVTEAIQKRLDRMMALGERTRQHQSAIGAVEDVAERLVKTVAQTDAHDRIALEQNQLLAELKRRQNRLDDRIQRNVDDLKKEMEKMDQMSVVAEQTQLKTDLENIVAETRELFLQLAAQQPISADPQKLAEQLDAFEKFHNDVMAKEDDVMLMRAKVLDQLKRCPDAELREDLEQELEQLGAEWNPLMQATKERKALMEKVKRIAEEMADAQKVAKEDIEEDARRLQEAKSSAEDVETEIENIATLQEAFKDRRPQIEALKQLGAKLEKLAPGPDANRTCRGVENIADDWERLVKDCKDAGRNAQRKNKLRLAFEKAVDEAEQLLTACRNNEVFAQCKNDDPEALAKAILEAQGRSDVLTKENVKSVLVGFEQTWPRQHREVVAAGNELRSVADADLNREIDDTVVYLDQNAADLGATLDNALRAFDAKEGAVTEFRQKIDSLDDEMTSMRERIKSLDSIGRDPSLLEEQYDECEQLCAEIEAKEKELKMLAIEWKKLSEYSGGTAASVGVPKDLERISRELEHQRSVLSKRKRSVSTTKKNVEDLFGDVTQCQKTLQALLDDPSIKEAPLGTADLGELREQQEALRAFREHLKPQKEVVADVATRCKEMIRSAGADVNTSELEKELRTIDDSWNAVASAAEERDRLIDGAIQHLGGYNDAHRALSNWLEETEEMMRNLAPPSADHKVVKTQLQNYEFQTKLIEDKNASVDGFIAMIGNIERLSGEGEQRPLLRAKANEVKQKYDELVEKANDRRVQLLEAAALTDQWQKLANPLKTWLEHCDKSLQALGNVPINTEQCEALLAAQEDLHHDLESKREQFDELVALFPQLAKLVSAEDSNELEATLHSLTSGYNQIGSCSLKCGKTLADMRENLGEFQQDADEFACFLDEVHEAITKLGDISVHPDDLNAQSEESIKIGEKLSGRDEVVMKLVEDARELCKHTSGSEALSLHSRIDGLRNRYMELVNAADQKMAVLQEAIDLSEDFQCGHDSLLEIVEGFETDLAHLDSISLEQQAQLVSNMEADLECLRPEVDNLNTKSKQLQQLASAAHGEELNAKTLEMNRRFNNVVGAVGRKSERLRVAELQSRQVFDDLDFLLDWFNEAHDRIQKSTKPSIEQKSLIHQIEGQRLMNHDIKLQKDDLRKVIAEASAVARHLNDVENGGQDVLIHEKIENAQKLSDETSRMADERLGVLEEAEMLVNNLDDHYGNLLAWLEMMEMEMREAPLIHIGSRPDQLLQEQQINHGQRGAIQSQRAIIEEFEQNAANLARLCNEEDAANLETIAGQIVERFNQINDEVRSRGAAIDDTLEHSSKFTDRLDSLLSNLESTAGQIRNADPISARPQTLKRQISDNEALIDSLRQKQGALEAMQQSAAEIVTQAKPNDPAVLDIADKLTRLEVLCLEIEQGSATRGAQLQETLVKAERFWAEYEQCLEAVDTLRKRLEAIDAGPGESPEHLKEQKMELAGITTDLDNTDPAIESMRGAGRELCKSVGGDEGVQIAQQIGVLERDWGTVTQLFAQREKDLVDAIEKSMQFHDLLSDLAEWMAEAEKTIEAMPPLSAGATVDDIRAEMQRIGALRKDADEHAVLKEQLNQSANQLCASAQPHQAAAIRAPISDLNNRWHRLYGQLNDRQQRLERGLLEMGQFNQAYEQLMGWMAQTEKTLDDIHPQPGNLKLIEIELCKHRVVQNDVDSHQPSFETLNNAGQYLIKADPASASTTQPKLDELNDRWHYLADRLNELWASLQAARNEAANMGDKTENWIMWLSDVDSDLAHSKPVGGLPETATTQYDDFLVTKAEVESRRADLEKHLDAGESYLTGDSTADSWFGQKHGQLKKLWTKVQERLVDRENKLQIALKDAEQLAEAMEHMGQWLDSAEQKLNQQGHVSRLPDGIDRQMKDHTDFHRIVQAQRAVLIELQNKAGSMQLSCEKKDAIPIKNRMVSLKHRFEKVQSRCADRTKALDGAFNDVRLFFDGQADLLDWIEEKATMLAEQETSPATTGDRIRQELEEHNAFARELADLQPKYDATERRGKALQEHAPLHEKAPVGEASEELSQKWTSLCATSVQRKRALEDALAQSGKFDEALKSLADWLAVVLPEVGATERLKGDIDTVKKLFDDHEAVNEEIASRKKGVERVRERAKLMVEAGGADDTEVIADVQEKLDRLNENWAKLETDAKEKDKKLAEALVSAEHFEDLSHSLLEWLCEVDSKIRATGYVHGDSEAEILAHMTRLETLRNEMEANRQKLEDTIHVGEEILVEAHPDAEAPMKNYIRIVTTRWDELEKTAAERAEKLEEELKAIREHNALVDDLIKFISQQNDILKSKADNENPEDLNVLDNMMKDHELFKFELQEKQPEVDESVKFQKKLGRAETDAESGKKAGIGAKKPLKRGAANKCEYMNDRWKKLWVDTMGYEQRLRAHEEYLKELERLKDFSFDEWRERYIEWNDHAKARVSDLFRRIDKTGTGTVPRKVFIDGIIASKFPTTLLEMERVADVFDKGDGMISSKEFMEALRFDPRKKHSMVHKKSDKERVDEEVTRQSARCTCSSRFPIQFISTTPGNNQFQYSFGTNTVKRMVRILRSTVMVRVGGGWEALDDFLLKHDPCRAKGRTNISLFYSDVRPSNAIDSMEEFTIRSNRGTPVRSSTPSGSGIQTTPLSYSGGTPGPIMKVREKTERSMRMFPSSGSASRGPHSRGTPCHSATPSRKSSATTPVNTSRRSSDIVDSEILSRLTRPTSASGSRSNLLDSRPHSRCSDISESSERPSRIPSLRGRKGVRYNGTGSPASPQPWKN
ncbi:hypothetical protein QR680_009719 [Steinernema hermaphroditum]|uniref:GAR domain-containing protein n=1 Tax=Steinernema hermaphroditum TaxID=289476 RepID=A0AA39ILE5_9BILA|nr:hypothetical protein QR680_009719 [Steinernema hermaphroditum]